MDFFSIPDDPLYTDQIRRFQSTDPGHADLFNAVVQELVNNDAFLKKALEMQQRLVQQYYEQLTAYVRQEIADLVGGAPSTLDTLGEIAQAMEDNSSVVDALDAAVGKKANAAEFDSHVKDSTVHITAAERSKWNSKAEGSHTHDDRYYTESEMDSKLNGKANSSHTHDDRYYTESEMNTKLNGKADSIHTHNYAAASHAHDDRYYTESEMNTKLDHKMYINTDSNAFSDYNDIPTGIFFGPGGTVKNQPVNDFRGLIISLNFGGWLAQQICFSVWGSEVYFRRRDPNGRDWQTWQSGSIGLYHS